MTANSNQEGPPSPSFSGHPRAFAQNSISNDEDVDSVDQMEEKPTRWSMGVLNDPETYEVPGSVLLLTGQRNEPLGLRNAPARTSASSLPVSPAVSRRPSKQDRASQGKKLTKDGKIILEPQPDESQNDPLNWPTLKRDAALLSLGLYCMVGGGMTPILAAGFNNVAQTYKVTVPKVALTTGLYMMGMGVGSVFMSPTAILYGKRPVYLGAAVLFICTSVWCAASPSYNSLLVARIFQGVSISVVECLPSATIAEIFFLHERAYRIGIYTLLLLGGKNLIPLVSAAIIESLSWRWVFWIVAMVGGFCWILLFLFVPETFWDRTPRPKSRNTSKSVSKSTSKDTLKDTSKTASRLALFRSRKPSHPQTVQNPDVEKDIIKPEDEDKEEIVDTPSTDNLKAPPLAHDHTRTAHVAFAPEDARTNEMNTETREQGRDLPYLGEPSGQVPPMQSASHVLERHSISSGHISHPVTATHPAQARIMPAGGVPPTPGLLSFNSDKYRTAEKKGPDYFSMGPDNPHLNSDGSKSFPLERPPPPPRYTTFLKQRPAKTFVQNLKPFNGRLHHDQWLRVAIRPFILFAYPAVLWSSIVYSCSVGWLIVLSESVAVIYRTPTTYGFSALSTGLIYISPFLGGVLGTAVAGKVSDIIVRAMSKRNGGLYEPEFRLVMAIPISITTVIGLMGFGWSAKVHDAWIVPTVFFGIISFGCSLGSTTAITFCVDSYRQYAGEALVTLNFSKNIFHGLVFSLFFTSWLEHDGSKSVFIWLGIIQLILMTLTIPMYIFGKRARMWTVRKNLMEKF